MHEEWTGKLSDYLDGELAPPEREAVESHLKRCAGCARVLEDLRRVVARAASMQPRPPAVDLWTGIAERLDGPTAGGVTPFPARAERHGGISSRRISLSLPELAAAAVLLMALSGGIVWSIARSTGRADLQVRGTDSTDPQVRGTARADAQGRGGTGSADLEVRADDIQPAAISYADQQYDAAVADLEKAVARGRGRLDASTIAIVEHNLQIIDQAIAQARQALSTDPSNSYLSGHLVEARRRKLDLLRRAAALTRETD